MADAQEEHEPAPVGVPALLRPWLELARSFLLLVLGVFVLIILFENRQQIGNLLRSVGEFEAFGVRVELRSEDIAQTIVSHRITDIPRGYLSPTQFQVLQSRAKWIEPVLVASKILWVDDFPEMVNNEVQFLTANGVSVRFATFNASAEWELKHSDYDLVVSDFGRNPKRDFTPILPLSKCPVFWFDMPSLKGMALGLKPSEPPPGLARFNDLYNKKPQHGPFLSEWMAEKITAEKRPDIVYYTGYRERVASACSDTITNDTFTLLSSIFDHLERRKGELLSQYRRPSPDGESKATGQAPEAAGTQP